MTNRQVAVVGGVLVALIVACAAFSLLTRGDPFAGLEIAVGLILGAWSVLLGREALRGVRLSRHLRDASEPAESGGVSYRIVAELGRAAVVVGLARPTIYLGTPLLAALQPDELAAVLRHEEHHRVMHAPLRAAALLAWKSVLGRIPRIPQHLDDRLTELEILADDAAMEKGSSPLAVLRAMLKTDPGTVAATSFNAGADRRIRMLVERAEGNRSSRFRALPFEWLAPLLLVIAVACHA